MRLVYRAYEDKGGGRGSTNAAGSGRTTARVRHHQGKPERDSREEQALRDGALPWDLPWE